MKDGIIRLDGEFDIDTFAGGMQGGTIELNTIPYDWKPGRCKGKIIFNGEVISE